MSPSHEEPRILQPGDTFRDWIVREFLGAGSGGEVYGVDHPIANASFALKVGHTQSRLSANQIARSIAQAKAVYELHHPNIVRVHDIGCQSDGRVWQLMERLDGCSLGELLGRYGALSPIYAIDICLHVAFALQAAHEHGIIHRDVHPWNIFVTSAGRVVLLDFSLAKVLPSGILTTRTHRGVGTAPYMSPERLKGAPASPQFDVYSLGITLWQLLVGRVPHENDDLAALIIRQRNDEPESLVTVAGLPARCDEVIRGATATDPQQRYAGMWPMIHALQALRAALLADPTAPRTVWEPPAWELERVIGRDPGHRSQYRPPSSLRGGGAPPAPVPSKRIVVSPAVAQLPSRAPIAATVPMPVFDLPPSPASGRASVAAPTVRGGAPAARRWPWAVLIAAPILLGLGAGVWLLATWDASAAPPASSVAANPRRPPAPPPKR